MNDLLIKKLTAQDYNADRYVQELSQNNVGDLSLQEHRQRIQQLAEDTNSQLKKNVFINYIQFIDTAKEISYLESEMYQLSHLITEQKSLLTNLLEISISGERGPGSSSAQEMHVEVNPEELRRKTEKENRKKLTSLVEKIEGCSHVMEVPDRFLVYDGDLLELNQDDYSAVQRTRCYLLSDSFMVTTWLSDRRGPVRYRFEKLFPLDQVLPVNIKDRGGAKNAFKLLLFPEPRVFQAPSVSAKRDWLDEIERAKSDKLSSDNRKAEHQLQEVAEQRQSSLGSKQDSLEDSNNPFALDDDDYYSSVFLSGGVVGGIGDHPSSSGPASWGGPPDWVEELPEELDQAIAQRNFEDAVELVDKGREFFLRGAQQSPLLSEMKGELESRVKTLVGVLLGELKVTPEKSLQGGPRAVRRATTLLVHLNRSSQACELFLKYRSALLKASLSRVRLEGDTSHYVRQLSSVVFNHVVTTGREFVRAFPPSRNSSRKGGGGNSVSAFVLWTKDEMTSFFHSFRRHVFTTQSSLSLVADCVNCADAHCKQLSSMGLEMDFLLHSLLQGHVEKWIVEGRDKMIEAVKLRAQDNAWRSTTTYDSKEQLTKVLRDMTEVGVDNFDAYVTGEKSVSLTSNTIQFTRAFINFLEDVLKMFWVETEALINESIATIFSAQLRHCRTSLEDPLFKAQTGTICRDAAFLLDVVLSVGEHRYAEVTGGPHPTLHTFHALRKSLVVTPSASSSPIDSPEEGKEEMAVGVSSPSTLGGKYQSPFI